jgi:hypothetical protein
MRVINEQPIDKQNRVYKATIILGPNERYTYDVFYPFEFPPLVYIYCLEPDLEEDLDWEATRSRIRFINRGNNELRFLAIVKRAQIRADIKVTKDNWQNFYITNIDYNP